MDSFFSLFDPADSLPRVKKERRKTRKQDQSDPPQPEEQPRRNSLHDDSKIKEDKKKRESPRRAAHVPEESSFLCEPELSADVLTKDVSYIDSFIDINYERKENDEKPKEETQEQKKKRSSGRKNRRKKKLSPPKDFIPRQCWNADNLFYPEFATAYLNSRRSSEEKVSWNNKHGGWRPRGNSNLGKNVNDLQGATAGVAVGAVAGVGVDRRSSIESDVDYAKKCKRKAEPFNLERQADGDLSLWTRGAGAAADAARAPSEPRALRDADLDTSSAYSSGEEDLDDSSSNMDEDSGDEVYGRLPPEPQLGNVEYKLKLCCPSDKRFQHLVTQLKWRLRSGGGSAVYVVGVRDCGALRGLRARALRASLTTLRAMAAALRATVRHMTTRRVAPHRAVAEVCIRKLADTQSVELRVAVMGANEAGKSTLIGVLTQGELDNGRGSARLNMFRHLHEVRSGRTSSLSHEILGFDAQGNVVNYGCSELMTAERIGERSAKLVSFLDLAGHSKYQRTTVHGLTGYCPHYVMLVVSATAGINRMTEEHLGLLLALDLPFFIVVTRVDLAPRELRPLLQRVHEILSNAGCSQRPQLIANEQQARSCAAPAQTPILDRLTAGAPPPDVDLISPDKVEQLVPVFPVSCVSGRGLNALHSYLLALEPPHDPLAAQQPDPEEEACEFQIDEIFRVGERSGPVVGGLLARGVLHEGEHLLIGPLDTGDFVPITINTIYRNRVPCGSVKAGQSASLGLSHRPPNLRQGMVIVAIPDGYVVRKESNESQSKLVADKNCNPDHSEDAFEEGIVYNNSNAKLDRRKKWEEAEGKEWGLECSNDAFEEGIVYNNGNTKLDRRKNREQVEGKEWGANESLECSNDALEEGIVYNNDNTKLDQRKKWEEAEGKEWLPECSKDAQEEGIIDNNGNTKLDRRKKWEKAEGKEWGLECLEEIVDNNDKTKLDRRKNREQVEANEWGVQGQGQNEWGVQGQGQKEWGVKGIKRKDRNILQEIANVESCLVKEKIDLEGNLYTDSNSSRDDTSEMSTLEESEVRSSVDGDELLLDDPNNPRGCLYFQATVHVLRHTTTICPGFQATVHIGNIRQTAIIKGILSSHSVLRSGESASVVFKFMRQPEYVRAGRKMLFRAGPATRGVGRLTQVFPVRPGELLGGHADPPGT